MYDALKVKHLLGKIVDSIEIVLARCANVSDVNDFMNSPEGMLLLDGTCMKLIAIGESVKNSDKVTNGELLPQYSEIPWREVMGMRDIIVHHYFEIDADVIFATIKENIPLLLTVVKKMERDI